MKRDVRFCKRMKCKAIHKDVCEIACAENVDCQYLEDQMDAVSTKKSCDKCKGKTDVPDGCLYKLERVVMKRGKK